jgi:hypothetical protein
MWLTWLVLVLVSASLMIVQAVLVLRDKVVGVPPMRQEEWSAAQHRFLNALRLFKGSG